MEVRIDCYYRSKHDSYPRSTDLDIAMGDVSQRLHDIEAMLGHLLSEISVIKSANSETTLTEIAALRSDLQALESSISELEYFDTKEDK